MSYMFQVTLKVCFQSSNFRTPQRATWGPEPHPCCPTVQSSRLSHVCVQLRGCL